MNADCKTINRTQKLRLRRANQHIIIQTRTIKHKSARKHKTVKIQVTDDYELIHSVQENDNVQICNRAGRPALHCSLIVYMHPFHTQIIIIIMDISMAHDP